jgi:hypothetical protein
MMAISKKLKKAQEQKDGTEYKIIPITKAKKIKKWI